MSVKYIMGLQVTDNIIGQGVLMQHIEVIVFSEGVDRKFPINIRD